jgi:hypothetical protein
LKSITAVGNPILKAKEQVIKTDKILRISVITSIKNTKQIVLKIRVASQDLLYIINDKKSWY